MSPGLLVLIFMLLLQVLPSGFEKALGLKSQPEILNLPLFIHGLELLVQNDLKARGGVQGVAIDRKDCSIFRAPPPPYFRKAMDQLGLVLPKKEEERLKEKTVVDIKYFKPKTKKKTSKPLGSFETEEMADYVNDEEQNLR